ncbi:hypothetical protein GHT87_09510 [Acinetobacter baumannii]|uniref:hypothetical protein n=1 Tax=Acinetobacter baumannii TaxID=470 RepID=UPI001EED9F89|nr:hypothetical protein [Acinetobacter baumannii]MCG6650683.1 hypothetical protein [Acinetobacter baumannii]
MRLYDYLDMEIERFKNQFQKQPNLYFIREDMLETLLVEKEAYANSTVVYFNNETGFYHYKSTYLIPVVDQFLKQCVISFEDLDNYNFRGGHNPREWPHKIKILSSTEDYVSVPVSVLKTFEEHYEKLKLLLGNFKN